MMADETAGNVNVEDPEWQWRAVLARNPTAEGLFYYGVRTTRVFCRPTCPARRPNRANVQFFDSTDAAEAAGFHSCARCRPEMISAEQQMVAHVQQLVATMEPAPTLAVLSRMLGISSSHLQRVFRRATGSSPREYAAQQRVARLKTELRRMPTVTEALYAAGYRSSRALYESAVSQLGMSPRSYKRSGEGEHILYGVMDSPLGRMLIASTHRGICALFFGDDADLAAALYAEFPRATLVEDDHAVAAFGSAIAGSMAQCAPWPDLPLDGHGTVFQHRVWDALRSIPLGQTRSYSEIARAIGQPSAVRAVAHACATNPVAYLVPCHRVLRADGHLGGYRWGEERKRALLLAEHASSMPATK